MELNSPLHILTWFGLIGAILFVVVQGPTLTAQQLVDRALENWYFTLPIAGSIVFLILFGDPDATTPGE